MMLLLLARHVWAAVRPVTAQQRLLWWCGALLVASGTVHAVVAVVDGGPWLGAVTWRKPVVFGLSFGILLWSAGWVLRLLPERRWGWLPAGLLAGTSVVEVALITLQRWRGVPSHFNADTAFDAAVWSVMGMSIVLAVLAVLVLLIWVLVRAGGGAATRLAAAAGLVAVLASGAVGQRMAATGEAVYAATGAVPDGVVFGAAGSAKLAHAAGLHGLQVLGLLAVVLGTTRLRERQRLGLVAVAVAGTPAVFAALAGTAYAGRAWTAPTPAIAVLGVAGLAALLVVGAVTAWQVRRPARAPAEPARTEAGPVATGMMG
ncbi:hypothetical protein GCM10010399_62990 [Dactylosporangium fulvum]|uniref:hypothetical protein n=1 Tax=Dactylosporangium fulvum TaxID=53359 RepID=UPI0031D0F295